MTRSVLRRHWKAQSVSPTAIALAVGCGSDDDEGGLARSPGRDGPDEGAVSTVGPTTQPSRGSSHGGACDQPARTESVSLRLQPIVTTMTSLPRLRATQTTCLGDRGIELEVMRR